MESSSHNPTQIILGFLAGLGAWTAAFAIQFFMALSVGSKLVFAICPVILAAIGAYYIVHRLERPAFTIGMLIALSLAFLVSSACGVQIATEGLGG